MPEAAAGEVIQARMAQMRRDYGIWLERELDDLAYESQALHASVDRLAWRRLRERLHKIAGGAGTFGFEKTGHSCRAIERGLDDALDGDDSAALFARVTERLAALPQSHIETLPTAADTATPQVEAASAARHKAPSAARDTHRVFILEADDALGEQIVQILESFDYRAEVFTDGAALLDACARQQPDALIVDLDYADEAYTDGLAIAEAIQHNAADPLPLFVSETATDFDQQLRAVRAGVEGFFRRPLEPMQIAEMLESHIRRNQALPLRVLVVDDDQATLAYHRLVLEQAGFSVRTVGAAAQTLAAMDSFNPDVLVLDVRMPGCSGPELAQIVRFHSRWIQVPIIYLSAVDDKAKQSAALTKAGDDFITKPVTRDGLVASVSAGARRARRLSAALSRDSLTGLLKHGDIKEQLGISLARARRANKRVSVAMIDIDYFKRVNDTYGHLVGDEVIRALANLLRRRLRESDLLGRYGGEEFLAVLYDCGASQAADILDELREVFAALEFNTTSEGFGCTFSAGICEAAPHQEPDALVGAADQHLYKAKRAGRNRVIAADTN